MPVKSKTHSGHPLKRNRNRSRGNSVSTIIREAPKRPVPKRVKPMLATLVDKPFDDPDWIFEVKWDGYRAIAILNGSQVSLLSRNEKSFDEKFYPVYDILVKWNQHIVLDGEIVVIDENGHSNFGALQNWRSEADGELILYLFDVLWMDGHDLRGIPLTDRKKF
jgi:bifunctional non-homologous end joining protein LigD